MQKKNRACRLFRGCARSQEKWRGAANTPGKFQRRPQQWLCITHRNREGFPTNGMNDQQSRFVRKRGTGILPVIAKNHMGGMPVPLP